MPLLDILITPTISALIYLVNLHRILSLIERVFTLSFRRSLVQTNNTAPLLHVTNGSKVWTWHSLHECTKQETCLQIQSLPRLSRFHP